MFTPDTTAVGTSVCGSAIELTVACVRRRPLTGISTTITWTLIHQPPLSSTMQVPLITQVPEDAGP